MCSKAMVLFKFLNTFKLQVGDLVRFANWMIMAEILTEVGWIVEKIIKKEIL